MGKAKMVGQFKPYLPNCRADMRRMKQYKRSREYTTRHEGVISEKREGGCKIYVEGKLFREAKK